MTKKEKVKVQSTQVHTASKLPIAPAKNLDAIKRIAEAVYPSDSTRDGVKKVRLAVTYARATGKILPATGPLLDHDIFVWAAFKWPEALAELGLEFAAVTGEAKLEAPRMRIKAFGISGELDLSVANARIVLLEQRVHTLDLENKLLKCENLDLKAKNAVWEEKDRLKRESGSIAGKKSRGIRKKNDRI